MDQNRKKERKKNQNAIDRKIEIDLNTRFGLNLTKKNNVFTIGLEEVWSSSSFCIKYVWVLSFAFM